MSNRLYFTSGQATPRESIEELSGVRILRAIDCEGGRLPAGASGTIVAVHAEGEAYSVEFEEPFHALVMARFAEIEVIRGESRDDIISSVGPQDR